MDKSMQKDTVIVNTVEVLAEPEVSEKPNGRIGFFQRRRNRIVLSITGAIIVILVVLIPVLHQLYFKPRKEAAEAPAKAAVEASTYAVVKANFPDPCLIEVNGGYYAFATRPLSNVTLHIQAASAVQSISQWTLHEEYDALPNLPPWVKSSNDSGVWAPQVVQRPDGIFVMYFAALHKDFPRKHCIGVATSSTILGPYDPGNATEPLVCHLQLGGIIDPAFLDDPISNQSLLIYKNDGNAIGSGGACANSNWPNRPTAFQYDAMTPSTYTSFLDTGLSTRFVTGTNSTSKLNSTFNAIEPLDNSTIFLRNGRFDGPNIESPQAWYQEYRSINSTEPAKRAYHLLYNSGCFADQSYRINHLVCWLNDTITSFTDCPWGDLKATSEFPLLASGRFPQPNNQPDALLYAPGGPGVTADGRYMAFHADIVPAWFNQSHPKTDNGHNRTATGVNNTSSAPGYIRQRALFIAELEEGDATNSNGPAAGLSIRRLIMPDS